ncbi:hypothetical protein RV13_GL003260 [Enterococcus raffinosus]|nr:hypothetical protein RV13_GL003260 [Enterococcus raffinosus]
MKIVNIFRNLNQFKLSSSMIGVEENRNILRINKQMKKSRQNS